MYNLGDAVETQAGGGNFVDTGIHDFMVELKYQPVGDSIFGETKKDGSVITFNYEQIRMKLTVIKTHAGKDAAGLVTYQGVLAPVTNDVEKMKKQLGRIIHIFKHCTTSDKVEAATEGIKKFKADTFKQLAETICKAFNNRRVRLKLVADQNGKYVQIPAYYSGFAECVDVDFSKSTLKYDEEKEGRTKKDSNAVEKNSETAPALFDDALDGGAINTTDVDDLPF